MARTIVTVTATSASLEDDGAGMTLDAGTVLDQLELKVGQLPVGHGLGQIDAAQEGFQVVGQIGVTEVTYVRHQRL